MEETAMPIQPRLSKPFALLWIALAMSRNGRRFVFSALLMSSSVAAFAVVGTRPHSVVASGLGFDEFPCASNAALTCVMDGMHNPRGIAFGPEGALYVAEAGCGGGTSDCQISAPLSSCVQPVFDGALAT